MSRALGVKNWRHAHRVLIFAALALGALAASFVYLGGVGFGESAVFYADFAYAAGLQTGSPVKVSGIRVGRIAQLALLTAQARPPVARRRAAAGQSEPAVVRATLQIQKSVRPYVTANSQWSVVTTGIIGDAYLELSPGTGDRCPEGATMRGVDAPHLHRIALATEMVLQQLAPLFDVAKKSADTGSGALAPPSTPGVHLVQAVAQFFVSNQNDLASVLRDSAEAAADVRAIAAVVHHALGDGAALSQILVNTQRVSQAISRDYPAMGAQTQHALKHLEKLMGRFEAQFEPQQMQAWRGDISDILAHTAAFSKDAHSIAQALAKGQGSLQNALHDPDLYDDLRALVHDLRLHPYKLIWRR